MALIRPFRYRGVTLQYLAFAGFEEFDFAQRRCTAMFRLYASKPYRQEQGSQPLVERAVRLRLAGEDFDRWVGKHARGGNLIAQVYAAAKALPVDYWDGRLPNLADAEDDL